MTKIEKRLGFSLVELLLAIFILGIGVISIATLFPAGIAQQQKTADDIAGPIVARNALTLIRSNVEQEDFGRAEDFEPLWSPFLCGPAIQEGNENEWPTICGDWMWRRPAIVSNRYGVNGDPESVSVRGAIDIFAAPNTEIIPGYGGALVEYWTSTPRLPGIPYNKERYPDTVYENGTYELNIPVKRIMASERQYPMWSGDPADRPAGEYYWDCMFRCYEGRVLVAIFVYRVVDPAQAGPYFVDTNGLSIPNLPTSADLVAVSNGGPWSSNDDELFGTESDDPTQQVNQWQYPGQWLVDQNGNVHTVQRGRRRPNDPNVILTASPSELAVFGSIENLNTEGVNVNWWDKDVTNNFADGFVENGVVTDIWYMPTQDSQGRKLIPVYALVEEL